MRYEIKELGKAVEIALHGRFTYGHHHIFQQILATLESFTSHNLRLDLSQVDFIDSSGLAMLLLLRDKARKAGGALTMGGAQGQVQRVLVTSHFHTLLPMSA
jgi:anti-anti-sigma factor